MQIACTRQPRNFPLKHAPWRNVTKRNHNGRLNCDANTSRHTRVTSHYVAGNFQRQLKLLTRKVNRSNDASSVRTMISPQTDHRTNASKCYNSCDVKR